MRRYQRILAVILLGLVGTVLLLAAGLATTAGQRVALSLAGKLVTSDNLTISIGRLEGSLFDNGRLARLTLADRDGTWLDVEDIRFRWSMLSLFNGRLDVDELRIATVNILREPVPSQATTQRHGNSIPLLPFKLDRFRVDKLLLGEDLAGQTAELEVEGSADLRDYRRGLQARIAAKRLDGPSASLSAQLIYTPDSKNLQLEVSASEASQGLVATALHMAGRPPMSLRLSGSGPLDSWRAEWSISAKNQPIVVGRVLVDRVGDRHRLATDVSGFVQPLAPPTVRNLLAGRMTGALVGHFAGLKRFDATHVSLRSDAMNVTGSGGVVPASSYVYGTLSVNVSRQDEQPVRLFLSRDDHVAARRLDLRLVLPDNSSKRDITLDVLVEGVTHDHGQLAKLKLSSRFSQTYPAGKRFLSAGDVSLQMKADGFASSVQWLQDAVGTNAAVDLTGRLILGGVVLNDFQARSSTARVSGGGEFSQDRLELVANVLVEDLDRFSGSIGQPLSGRMQSKIESSFDLRGSKLKILFDGSGDKLRLGQGMASRLLGQSVMFSGSITRDAPDSFTLKSLELEATNVRLAAHGRLGRKKIELKHKLDIGDLSALHPLLAGAGTLIARIDGTRDDFASDVRLTATQARWRDQPVNGFVGTFKGTGPASAHAGRVALNGSIGSQKVWARSDLVLSETPAISANGLTLAVGRNKLSGFLRLGANLRTTTGRLQLKAEHLKDLRTIVGQDVDGSLSGAIEVSVKEQVPVARFNIAAPSASFAAISIKALRGSGVVKDFMSDLGASASLSLAALSGDGYSSQDISLKLEQVQSRVAFAAAAVINKADVNLQGAFRRKSGTTSIFLDQATLQRAAAHIRLMKPARLVLDDKSLAIDKLRLSAGPGFVELHGAAQSTGLKIDAKLTRVPAAIAHAFAPDRGLRGSIDGRVSLRGRPDDPAVIVTASWQGASGKSSRESNLPPLDFRLDGQYRNGITTGRVDVSGPDRLALTLIGDVKVQEAQSLNLRLSGDVPLSIANSALAVRATQFSGRARMTGKIEGTISQPKLAVKIAMVNASLNDPVSGLKLERLNGRLSATERGLNIESVSGHGELGGTINLSGTVLREAKDVIWTRLNLELAKLRFNDRQLLAGDVDGKFSLIGPIDNLAARGSAYIRRLDVTVPAATPRSIAELDIKHINPPKQLAAIVHQKETRRSAARTTRIALDISVDAANRIFVRGRGLDAQLGGSIRVGGSSAVPTVDGEFALERGRLEILGRRLEFRRGRILFDGELEPVLDMEAITTVDDVTIVVTISGSASAPVFKFSSVPELPEDEIIARLLFNKGLVGLSPLQLVQLANEVDKIGGLSTGRGIVEQIKRSVGIDVLDVSTDRSGTATVSAGRYVNDKTFVGVKQGPGSKSGQVVIDHDFTKNLKARSEVGANGNSKVGVGLEWNY